MSCFSRASEKNDEGCVVVVVEPGHRDDRTEDLLLEDPHVVRALEHRRRDVVSAAQVAAEATCTEWADTVVPVAAPLGCTVEKSPPAIALPSA
mgnify:CR=1 FL=1